MTITRRIKMTINNCLYSLSVIVMLVDIWDGVSVKVLSMGVRSNLTNIFLTEVMVDPLVVGIIGAGVVVLNKFSNLGVSFAIVIVLGVVVIVSSCVDARTGM